MINNVCYMRISAFWDIMCFLIRYIGISVSEVLDSSTVRVFFLTTILSKTRLMVLK